MRTGYHFAGALKLADLPDDHVALEAAQAIEEQDAVEVIDFVLQCAGQQSRAFDYACGARPIERA